MDISTTKLVLYVGGGRRPTLKNLNEDGDDFERPTRNIGGRHDQEESYNFRSNIDIPPSDESLNVEEFVD